MQAYRQPVSASMEALVMSADLISAICLWVSGVCLGFTLGSWFDECYGQRRPKI